LQNYCPIEAGHKNVHVDPQGEVEKGKGQDRTFKLKKKKKKNLSKKLGTDFPLVEPVSKRLTIPEVLGCSALYHFSTDC
jgi:hypothetical protein